MAVISNSEVRIYIKENKKVRKKERKHALDHENDQPQRRGMYLVQIGLLNTQEINTFQIRKYLDIRWRCGERCLSVSNQSNNTIQKAHYQCLLYTYL